MQVEYLLEHPDVDLVGTAMQRFDENGLHSIMHPVLSPDQGILRYRAPFYHATIMTYKRIYDALDGYTVANRTVRIEDLDLWFRFYKRKFCGRNIDKVLYYVRENQETIHRRTMISRFQSLQTTVWGFHLLGFPKRWIVEKVIILCIKNIIPYRIKQCIRDKRDTNRGA